MFMIPKKSAKRSQPSPEKGNPFAYLHRQVEPTVDIFQELMHVAAEAKVDGIKYPTNKKSTKRGGKS